MRRSLFINTSVNIDALLCIHTFIYIIYFPSRQNHVQVSKENYEKIFIRSNAFLLILCMFLPAGLLFNNGRQSRNRDPRKNLI